MKNLKLSLLFASCAVAVLAGCQPHDPQLTAPPKAVPAVPPEKPFQTADSHFDFARSESTVQQAKYDENIVTAYFTMNNGKQANNGTQPIEKLQPRDIKVTENGRPVTEFSLAVDEKHTEEIVNLAIAVDVTASMGPSINSAKRVLKSFILASMKGKYPYHIRICLTSFGDYTYKKCDRFYDTTAPAQATELMTELARLQNFTGKQDPGYPDLDENPMRNLIDLANAPWASTGQRFVILVTDAGFLYTANHEGDATNPGGGANFWASKGITISAPRMSEVTEALKRSKMKVFAVTRTQGLEKGKVKIYDGYNTPFQGEPSIVQTSGGEYFNFDEVLKGRITLDSILQRILNRVDMTYKLTYVVDKNPGLDVTLPEAKRLVQVQPVNPAKGIVKMGTISSSKPDGRPQYQTAWKVSDNAIDQDSLRVSINGAELSRSDYSVNAGTVTFVQPPKAGANIKFTFLYQDIAKNFRIEPMTFKGPLNSATTQVFLNGKKALPEDVIFSPDLEGNSSLKLADSALASNDPYDIRKNQGVSIHVVTK